MYTEEDPELLFDDDELLDDYDEIESDVPWCPCAFCGAGVDDELDVELFVSDDDDDGRTGLASD